MQSPLVNKVRCPGVSHAWAVCASCDGWTAVVAAVLVGEVSPQADLAVTATDGLSRSSWSLAQMSTGHG